MCHVSTNVKYFVVLAISQSRQMDRWTDGRGATLNAIYWKGRVIIQQLTHLHDGIRYVSILIFSENLASKLAVRDLFALLRYKLISASAFYA